MRQIRQEAYLVVGRESIDQTLCLIQHGVSHGVLLKARIALSHVCGSTRSTPSRRLLVLPVFVMQTTQDGARHHTTMVWQLMPVRAQRHGE